MSFHETSVWFLLLLLLVPLIWWRYFRKASRSAVRFSSIALLLEQRKGWAVRGRLLLPLLRTLAAVLLIVCLARPRKGNQETRIFAEGVAIQMLVDRSGSMQAMDFQIDGEPVDRLAAVKAVVRDFIFGEGDLTGRPDDLIGLIVFGTYADSLCPLTLDHEYLFKTLDGAQVAKTNEEAATAIGDAVALAVERLRMVEQRRHLSDAYQIKSKIMVLLTDGENTAGDIEPLQAAEMAAAFGIKIYTIGAGTRGMAPMPAVDIFGRKVMRRVPVTIDEETLRKIASTTDGRYFRATDTQSLQEIYATINELEKTEVEERRYMEYQELATSTVRLGSVQLPPLLLVALIVIVMEITLANTRLRKIP